MNAVMAPWVLPAKLYSMRTTAMMPAAGCECTHFSMTLSALDFCPTFKDKKEFQSESTSTASQSSFKVVLSH